MKPERVVILRPSTVLQVAGLLLGVAIVLWVVWIARQVITWVLVSAFLGWMVWGWINAVRGVARTAPLLYLMPPVAGLVAWGTTGEHYTAIKIAGAALALGGVALAQYATPSRHDPVRESVAPVD